MQYNLFILLIIILELIKLASSFDRCYFFPTMVCEEKIPYLPYSLLHKYFEDHLLFLGVEMISISFRNVL